jgi:hypothetical protein
MTRHDMYEFLVTVLAIMAGLVAGKFLSQLVGKTGVSISSNDPLIVALPPVSTSIPSPAVNTIPALATPALASNAGGN